MSGNVDLALRSLQLSRLRATGAPELPDAERDYAAAAALQARRLEAAGVVAPTSSAAAPR